MSSRGLAQMCCTLIICGSLFTMFVLSSLFNHHQPGFSEEVALLAQASPAGQILGRRRGQKCGLE